LLLLPLDAWRILLQLRHSSSVFIQDKPAGQLLALLNSADLMKYLRIWDPNGV